MMLEKMKEIKAIVQKQKEAIDCLYDTAFKNDVPLNDDFYNFYDSMENDLENALFEMQTYIDTLTAKEVA